MRKIEKEAVALKGGGNPPAHTSLPGVGLRRRVAGSGWRWGSRPVIWFGHIFFGAHSPGVNSHVVVSFLATLHCSLNNREFPHVPLRFQAPLSNC